jgi:hypothetical protein
MAEEAGSVPGRVLGTEGASPPPESEGDQSHLSIVEFK